MYTPLVGSVAPFLKKPIWMLCLSVVNSKLGSQISTLSLTVRDDVLIKRWALKGVTKGECFRPPVRYTYCVTK